MLVLSRKQSQQITIGPDIRITIVKLERNQVRLGIEAPRDIPVLRAELLARDEADNGAGHRGNERPQPQQEPRRMGHLILFDSRDFLAGASKQRASGKSAGPTVRSRRRGQRSATGSTRNAPRSGTGGVSTRDAGTR